MNLIVAIALLTWLSPLMQASSDAKPAVSAAQSKALDGTWRPQSAELAGKKFPEEVLKNWKLTLEGEKYTVEISGQIDKGTVKIDPKATPATMDITGVEGPNKGKTFPAIYELKDETLRICYDLSGKQRPTEFKTVADTQQFLVHYQRAKPQP